ncbi:FxSxx-COOH system tetratricopeptide repeat protein [Nocardia aurea]|uniref:FxSxx-COOH system tetratricopeptide repeat protein n=1 Tax=Nocardia aurea TaxID=2144174 RepID=A0ABV3G5M1_9NOCA
MEPASSVGGALVVGRIPNEPRSFVDRDQIARVGTELTAGSRGVAVVCGMRGAGKTHVAAAYARRSAAEGVGLVGWVNAETADTLYAGLAEVASRVGVVDPDGDPRTSAHRLRDHLTTRPGTGLLVLDNATDVGSVREILPATGNTQVVITSTDRAFGVLGVVVDVGTGYTRTQSVVYLDTITGLHDPVGAGELAAELGDLPLALATAAAAIASSGSTYPRFLQRVLGQRLPRAMRQRIGQDHPLRVDQAILVSLDEARTPAGDAELDAAVVWLLGLFAVFDPAGIGRELLVHPDPDLDEWVEDAIDHLVQRSLLTWSAGRDALLTHRLTARVLREQALDTDTADRIMTNALDVLLPQLFDEDQAWSRQLEGARIVDHIDALTSSGLPARTSHETQTRILSARRWATAQLTAAADYVRAVQLARHTLVDHELLHSADSFEIRRARYDLANAYRAAGLTAEAIPLYEQTLADSERVLGPDHPDTLNSRNNLANAYRAAGRTDETLPLYEQNLAVRERVSGPDNPTTLDSRNNLATAYQDTGRTDEAISLHEQNLADRERVSGPDHPRTLNSRNNLATAYQAVGRTDEAISLHEQNLADRERVLGPDHPRTLDSRNNLANAYRVVGRTDEAISLHEQNLADRERVLGPDHPDTLNSRNNLANAYRVVGRTDEAISLHEQNLADSERVLGPDHPHTLNSRNNLALLREVQRSDNQGVGLG